MRETMFLYGKGGNDFLDGGTGGDVMVRGRGNTSYRVDNAFDAVVEFFGGSDTVHSSINYILGQVVDHLKLDVTATSGTGNDRLLGGLGADNLDGGSGTDMADYSTSVAGLTVSLLSSALNTGEAAGDTFTSVENLKGGNYADMLYGSNAANVIFGGKGCTDLAAMTNSLARPAMTCCSEAPGRMRFWATQEPIRHPMREPRPASSRASQTHRSIPATQRATAMTRSKT